MRVIEHATDHQQRSKALWRAVFGADPLACGYLRFYWYSGSPEKLGRLRVSVLKQDCREYVRSKAVTSDELWSALGVCKGRGYQVDGQPFDEHMDWNQKTSAFLLQVLVLGEPLYG